MLNASKLVVQLRSSQWIEGAERLVHQQDGRIDRERPGDPDALPLSARQLVRPAGSEAIGRKADQLEQLADSSRNARGRPILEPRHDPDVLLHGHVGKKTDLLQHVSDAPSQPNRLPVASVAALDHHVTGVRQQQSVDELQQRRLAGPAATDKPQDLPRLDREAETVEHAQAVGSRKGDRSKLDGPAGHAACDGITVTKLRLKGSAS